MNDQYPDKYRNLLEAKVRKMGINVILEDGLVDVTPRPDGWVTTTAGRHIRADRIVRSFLAALSQYLTSSVRSKQLALDRRLHSFAHLATTRLYPTRVSSASSPPSSSQHTRKYLLQEISSTGPSRRCHSRPAATAMSLRKISWLSLGVRHRRSGTVARSKSSW